MTVSQTYVKHLSEPWFSLVKLGLKISEGRVNKDDWRLMNRGDKIIFTNDDLGFKRTHTVKITDICHYKIFYDYLNSEKIYNCLPGIDSINEGVSVYRKYYTVEEEQRNGVISIRF